MTERKKPNISGKNTGGCLASKNEAIEDIFFTLHNEKPEVECLVMRLFIAVRDFEMGDFENR